MLSMSSYSISVDTGKPVYTLFGHGLSTLNGVPMMSRVARVTITSMVHYEL